MTVVNSSFTASAAAHLLSHRLHTFLMSRIFFAAVIKLSRVRGAGKVASSCVTLPARASQSPHDSQL